MFNCFKKKEEEPKKGLEIKETSPLFVILYNNMSVGYIKKENDGLYKACLDPMAKWNSPELLAIADKLQDLNRSH